MSYGAGLVKEDFMPSEFPRHDPQNIWQNQTTERFKMSADELRHRAQQHRKKARLRAQFSIVTGLILFVFFARAFAKGGDVIARMGWGLISVWCLYFAYHAYRWTWPRRLEPDAALDATIKSYRSALEKRQDYARHIWRRAGLTFCFLGLGLVVVPGLMKSIDHPARLMNFVPILVLLALWLKLFFSIRRRDRQKLQQEIEELQAFETGPQA